MKLDEAISSNIHQQAMIQLLNDSIIEHNDRLSNIQNDLNSQIKEKHGDGNETTDDQISRIEILETKLEVNQNLISNHTAIIEVIQKQSHDQNSSIESIKEKVLDLESVMASDQYLSVNKTDKIKQLEETLHDQNTSILRIDENISNLQLNQELDRNNFKQLKNKVLMLEGNVTEDAIMLQTITSNLEVIDHEMTMIADMVHIQQDSQEQVIENMTVLRIDLISLNYSLNDLEARINASEFSWLHNENRMDKLELRHSLETALNEEQEATINKLEEKLNKTAAIMQDIIESAKETPGECVSNLSGVC